MWVMDVYLELKLELMKFKISFYDKIRNYPDVAMLNENRNNLV